MAVDKNSNFTPETMKRMTLADVPRILTLVLVGLGLVPFPSAVAQPVGEKVGPQFPFITSSARVAGIADASCAIIDDFSGFSSNPGTLALMKRSAIDYTMLRVQKGVTFEHLGLSYKATSVDAIAISVDVLHFGGTDFYTDSNVRNLGFEMRTGLVYSRALGEQLAVGMNLQAFTSTTGTNSVWAFVSDIGLAYAPGKYIRYGLSLRGMGSDYDISSQILPTDILSRRMPKVLVLGIALDYPFADKTQRILMAFQNEKVLGERTIIYKIGFEYSPFWSPFFRAGVRGGFIIREPDLQPRFGLGIGYSQFSLDYAYSYTRRYIQPSHMFTLAFAW